MSTEPLSAAPAGAEHSTVTPAQPVAEHRSLSGYLADTLTVEQRRHIALLSFNQWRFTLAALADTALAAHAIGSEVTVGFWADRTPLEDPGWTTSRRIARFLGSRSMDDRVRDGLLAAGLPKESVQQPPIRRWKPAHPITIPEPLTRAAIRAMRYDGSGMGRSILQVHPDFNTPIRDDYVWPTGWITAATRSYAWVYDQTLALIRERGITTLVVYNGRFTHDRAAAAAAEHVGVKVLYYDAGGLETAFDLTTSTTHDWQHLQERMIELWDRWDGEESRESIGRRWFEDRQAHKEPGLHVFVEHQQRGHLEGIPEAEQLVAFFSSSGDEIAELELDWSEYLQSQEQALMTLADACRARPGTKLVVRTHPHMRLKPADDLKHWRAAVEAATPVAHFDAGSPVDSYALMREADIVFTYGSTSGVEAAYLGKPVVVMGPSAYDILGCVERVRDRAGIEGALADPPRHDTANALKYGLMMERRGFAYEFVSVSTDGVETVGGVRLDEAASTARKVSHALGARRTQRLTAR